MLYSRCLTQAIGTNMRKSIVPGHFWAITLPLLIVLTVVASIARRGDSFFFGADLRVIVMVLGMFIADQATHLAQEAHSDPAPTWIERFMQHHKFLCQVVGVGVAALGCYLLMK